MIEAHAKLAKTLARAGQGGPALAASETTRSFLEKTPVEPTNVMFRSFFATTYADLGEAHAALASAAGTPSGQRGESWRVARDMYRRSLDIWQDLRARGILGKIDEGRPAEVERAIARCDRMLGPQPR